MSIRRTIESLLGDEQQQEAFRASPEAYFAEHGIEDIPGDLIGTAFVHYSDTAPIEHGDAVAGIATHYSAVPFEADDLPELGEDGDGSPFATLGRLSDDDRADPYDTGVDEQPVDLEHTAFAVDVPSDDAEAIADDDTPTESDTEPTTENTDDDQIDSASYDEDDFDDGFSDGFDEAEALELDTDFGDGGGQHVAPSEILGEIHGVGPLDPEVDDPFFDEVTDAGQPVVHLDLDPIEFEQSGLAVDLNEAIEPDHGAGEQSTHDAFLEHHAEDFGDVDPGDLDLDDF